MIVRTTLEELGPITQEEIEMLKRAEKMPIVFDEDCPELTAEQLKSLYRAKDAKRRERNKQTITIRLSPRAVRKARSLGKGYTSVLGRILESALNDNEAIKNYL